MTRRLSLSATTVSDADALFPLMSDPAGWWFEPESRHAVIDQTIDWLRRSEDGWNSGDLSYWVARNRRDGALVGIGGAQRRAAGYWNLSWRIAASAQGKGYATELAEVAIAAAQKQDPLLPVIAWITPTNTPSIHVAERAGLVNRGRLTDPGDGLTRLAFTDRPYPVDETPA
jgi:RimJ/RimL family protein N-acetyltransferase